LRFDALGRRGVLEKEVSCDEGDGAFLETMPEADITGRLQLNVLSDCTVLFIHVDE
jgi:hypothetical protein